MEEAKNALSILDRVTAMAPLTRPDHIAVQAAVQTLGKLIAEQEARATKQEAPPTKPSKR